MTIRYFRLILYIYSHISRRKTSNLNAEIVGSAYTHGNYNVIIYNVIITRLAM